MEIRIGAGEDLRYDGGGARVRPFLNIPVERKGVGPANSESIYLRQ